MAKVSLYTPAPDFELSDLSGRKLCLSDFRGKTVVLIFNRGLF